MLLAAACGVELLPSRRRELPGCGSAFAEGICGESCNVLRLGAVSRWADLDVNMAGLRDKKSI